MSAANVCVLTAFLHTHRDGRQFAVGGGFFNDPYCTESARGRESEMPSGHKSG